MTYSGLNMVGHDMPAREIAQAGGDWHRWLIARQVQVIGHYRQLLERQPLEHPERDAILRRIDIVEEEIRTLGRSAPAAAMNKYQLAA